MTNLETKLAEALRFYADQERYRGPNQRYEGGDPYTDAAGVKAYLLDVTRDGGEIARTALATYEREKAGRAEKISQMLAATGAIQPLGNWRDAQGSNYKAPIGAYKVGQFSPTGSQLVSVCKKGDKS